MGMFLLNPFDCRKSVFRDVNDALRYHEGKTLTVRGSTFRNTEYGFRSSVSARSLKQRLTDFELDVKGPQWT